jgi:hypothetical protein
MARATVEVLARGRMPAGVATAVVVVVLAVVNVAEHFCTARCGLGLLWSWRLSVSRAGPG